MIITKTALPRRTFLRGMGVTMALPLLDAMVPALSAFARTAAYPVKRLGFIYIANGAAPGFWTPKGEGRNFEFSSSLAPLEPLREHVFIPSGLEHRMAEGYGDGNGEHTRSTATFLSGTHPKLTEGADVRAGITADQIAARALGQQTRLPSLELQLDPNYLVGNCENGYSCTYMNTISWRSATQPNPMENNPRIVFERLFGEGGTTDQRAAQLRKNRSILDTITGQMSGLRQTLGPSDRVRVGEYFDSIREVERRIQIAEKADSESTLPELLERPIGIPDSYDAHSKLMFDLWTLAYQADVTRVVTKMMCREVNGRTYPWIGVNASHHNVSHHQLDPGKLADYAKINTYHVSLLAYFLDRLRSTPDGDGTLLDNAIIVYGGGLGDGDRHDHINLPIVVAGGGDRIRGGRHVTYPEGTPMTNLLLSVLQKAGVNVQRLGDSNGPLPLEPLTDL
jgi:hypothetical protein